MTSHACPPLPTMDSSDRRMPSGKRQRETRMNTTGHDNQMNHLAGETDSLTPAVVCCATGLLGLLGLVAVAAAPWLLLA